MDSLIIAGFVLSTVAFCFGFVLLGVVAYVIYRYCYAPWKVMRSDIIALNVEIQGLKQQAQVRAITDAEAARAEARLNARTRARIDMARG